MISKTISLDEKVNALSDDTARLLFTWLIPHLDCEGRQHGDAMTIKSIVFPRRNISPKKIAKYLKEMEKLELILRYSVNGNAYLCAPRFEKHQTGLQKTREAQSQIPPFTPDLLQSKVQLSHLEDEDEVKDKVKDKEEDASTSFNSYKEKLRITYQELDIEEQWERCRIWFKDHKKVIKSPSLALGNWCKKEMEIKKEVGRGTHQGAVTGIVQGEFSSERQRDMERQTKIGLAYRTKRKELGRDLTSAERQEIENKIDKEVKNG